MLITPHVWAGVLVGRLGTRNKPLAIVGALASHFFLDRLPHWNPRYPSKLVSKETATLTTDAIVGGLGLALLHGQRVDISGFDLLCGFAAILPDIVGLWEFKAHPRWFDRYIAFDRKLQNHVGQLPGATVQIACAGIAFYALYKLGKR